MASINERQRRFIAAYLIEPTGEKAAIAAGYKPSRAKITAAELLRRPDIVAAIQAGQLERQERMGFDADRALRETLEIVAEARRGVPRTNRGELVRGEDGEVIYDPNWPAAVSGMNLASRMVGLFAPSRVEHEHSGEVVYTLHIDTGPDAIVTSPPAAIEAEGWDA